MSLCFLLAVVGRALALECPKNCGSPELGGGTCRIRPSDGVLICSSCNSNRIRQKGLCLLEVHCRARTVQSGKLKGQGCKCSNLRCHNCKRRSEATGGDTCTVCRDGWYLHDGDCVEVCPAGMARSGISLFRRRCLAPYTCKGGRIFDGSFTEGNLIDRGESFGCRCPAPGNKVGGDCFACEHRANEVGDRCVRCSGGKYLSDGACVNAGSCPNGTVPVGVGNYGRECKGKLLPPTVTRDPTTIFTRTPTPTIVDGAIKCRPLFSDVYLTTISNEAQCYAITAAMSKMLSMCMPDAPSSAFGCVLYAGAWMITGFPFDECATRAAELNVLFRHPNSKRSDPEEDGPLSCEGGMLVDNSNCDSTVVCTSLTFYN